MELGWEKDCCGLNLSSPIEESSLPRKSEKLGMGLDAKKSLLEGEREGSLRSSML